MPLEILHVAFVPLCRSARLEGAEIAALAGLRIDLAGIEPVFAGLQFADHGVASFDVLSRSIETAAPVFPHDEINLPHAGPTCGQKQRLVTTLPRLSLIT